MSILPHRLVALSAYLFLPLRRLAGPFHRRQPALTEDQRKTQQSLPPLPAPWNSDDRWYRGGTPPRRHNRLTPLVHGDSYFPDLIAEMQVARQRVTICGWCLTPLMTLRHDENSILAEILRDVSQHADVYVLLWSGAPVLFEPDVHLVEGVRRRLLTIAPKVHCVLDHTASFSHDHHQKAVTVDGRVAYVGGMDLTTFQGNRVDNAQHPLRYGPNWHDAQVKIEGEAVRDVEENFCQRWNAVTGESLHPIDPVVDPGWDTPAQIVRTVPAGFYSFASKGEYGIHHALIAGIRSAEHFIYLENQYIWSPEIVAALCDAMARPRQHPFRIVLVLPALAYSGRYDNDRHVQLLRKHNRKGRQVFEAYSIYAAGPADSRTGYQYRPIYVHAKVAIVDDQWFAIGSANLNSRGLATDTEMDVQSVAPDIARALRIQLWAEHLGWTEEQVAQHDPIELIDGAWKDVAADLAHRLHGDLPPGKGQVRRYKPDPHPLGLILDRLQSATLEH